MSGSNHLIKIFPETDLADIQRIELNAVREMVLRSTQEKELEAMKNPKPQELETMKNPKPQSRIEAMDQLSFWGDKKAEEKKKKFAFITPTDDFIPLKTSK